MPACCSFHQIHAPHFSAFRLVKAGGAIAAKKSRFIERSAAATAPQISVDRSFASDIPLCLEERLAPVRCFLFGKAEEKLARSSVVLARSNVDREVALVSSQSAAHSVWLSSRRVSIVTLTSAKLLFFLWTPSVENDVGHPKRECIVKGESLSAFGRL